MDYRINKGAGRPIEFKGLKSQYLFFFAGGLVSVFLAVVVLYMAGVSQLVCLSFGAVSGSLAVWLTFRMNARYGEHGLMKMLAEKRHPRYLSARRRIFRALTKKKRDRARGTGRPTKKDRRSMEEFITPEYFGDDDFDFEFDFEEQE